VNPALYADGTIVIAPRDSDRVFGMDGASGKILWSADRSRTPCLAGAGDGAVFLAGAVRIGKLDIRTGKPLAGADTRAAGLLPVCRLAGSRLWVGSMDGLRVFDTKTLEPVALAGNENRSARVVVTDDCIVSVSKDSFLSLHPRDGAPSPPARTPPVRPASLKSQPLSPCPPGHRPVLRWHTRDVLENLYVPEEHRGVLLSWNAYEMRLHDLNGFGQALWERAVPGPTKVLWSGDRIGLAAPGHVHGLDGRTGADVWKHPCAEGDPYLTLVDGAFCFMGPKHRTVLCVEAGNGKARWTADLPEDLVKARVARSGSALYLVGRNGKASGPWDVRALDAKTGAMRKVYSRKATHHAERFYGIYGGNIVWTLGAAGWAEALKDGKKTWEVKSTRWSINPRPVNDGNRRLLFMDVDRGNDVLLDPAKGTTILKRDSGKGPREIHMDRGNCYAWAFTRRISPRFIRVKTDGRQGKYLWEHTTKRWDWGWRHAMSVTGGSVRAAWKYDRWLMIADLDKKTGKPLRTPVMMHVPDIVKLRWLYDGNFLLVENREGMRCFRMTDPKTDLPKWTAQRTAAARRLRDPQDRADALAGVRIGASMLGTLDASWIAGKEPLVLDREWFWFPVRESGLGYRQGAWKGKDDLSAKMTITFKRYVGYTITLEIVDDHWEPFDGERGGDFVTIRAGRVNVVLGAGPDGRVRWRQLDGKSIFGKNVPTVTLTDTGRTYKITPTGHHLSLRHHNIDTVTVIDDDGDGPRGGMEWGSRFYRKSK
jgi:outer membrane protein assembly factor BamB